MSMHIPDLMALEAIHFQDGTFFKELTQCFIDAQKGGPDYEKANWPETEKAINECIKKHTGLLVETKANLKAFNAQMTTGVIDYQNVLLAGSLKGAGNTSYQAAELKRLGGQLKNCVDLKKGRVTGIAEKVPLLMEFSGTRYLGGVKDCFWSPAEAAAIMLHEVGHGFTYFEMMDRVVSTNQLLAEMRMKLTVDQPAEKRILVIKETSEELGFNWRDIERQVTTSDNEVVTGFLFTKAVKNFRTESGNDFLDASTWELLADQFAARHGAAKDLFTGLRKISLKYGDNYSEMSNSQAMVSEIASWAFNTGISAVFGVAAGAAVGIAAGIVVFMVAMRVLIPNLGEYGESVYSTTYHRYKRIRYQLVARAKQELSSPSKHTKTIVKQIEEQIKFIDEGMKNMADRKTFCDKVRAFFNSAEANRQADTLFQREIEELGHNELFDRALSLKNI